MVKQIAIFVDWDNLRFILQKIKRNHAVNTFDFNDSSHISQLFHHFLINETEEIYRIFFYTAKPIQDSEIESQLRNRDKERYRQYSQQHPNQVYNRASNFLQNIVQEDYVALRTGKMQVRGIDGRGKPEIVQKQVDMLIGLDISEVSFKRLADRILVFSKDTDMIPALKTARTNGLTVMLANFTEDNYIAQDLVTHSDLIRTKSLCEFANTLI